MAWPSLRYMCANVFNRELEQYLSFAGQCKGLPVAFAIGCLALCAVLKADFTVQVPCSWHALMLLGTHHLLRSGPPRPHLPVPAVELPRTPPTSSPRLLRLQRADSQLLKASYPLRRPSLISNRSQVSLTCATLWLCHGGQVRCTHASTHNAHSRDNLPRGSVSAAFLLQ